MQKLKNIINKKTGITLVALVVTIIILLILASVVLVTLMGENGIVEKAKEGQEIANYETVKEEIKIIWNDVQIYKADKNLTEEETASYFEEQLRQQDPSATVKYQRGNKTYEVFYRGYTFEVQEDGSLTNNREEVKKKIEDAWKVTITEKPGVSNEEKANKLEEELKKEDPDSTAKYNPNTGKIEVSHGGYEGEVDEKGNVTIKEPTQKPGNIEKVEITSEPSDISAIEGNTATFKVGAKGSGTLTYQWYKNSINSTTNGSKISGATKASYTTQSLKKVDNNTYYYCEITQKVSGQTNKITSRVAKLTVGEKVKITSEPSDTSAIEGNTATFEVKAQGEGTLTYQWYKNSINSTTNGSKISGATKASYTTQNLKNTENNTYYYCEISQSYNGSTAKVTSRAAKLTVGGQVQITGPEDVAVLEKEEVRYKIEVTGSYDNIQYQWYKNNSNSTENGTKIEGATNKEYIISQNEVTTNLNNTYYYCKVTGSYGENVINKTSKVAKLEVKARISNDGTTQASIEGPGDITIIEKSKEATFEVKVTGVEEGELTYKWYKNTQNATQGGEEILGANQRTYTIPQNEVTQDKNNTYYYCEITQTYGKSSYTILTAKAGKLTVIPSQIEGITITPNQAEAYTDTNTTYQVQIAQEEGVSYEWYYNITGSEKPEESTKVGETSKQYVANFSKEGTYTILCKATQRNGTEINKVLKATLIVAKRPSKENVEIIPKDVTNYVGKAQEYTVNVKNAIYKDITYRWYYNKENVEGEGIQGGKDKIYQFTPQEAGIYYISCVVTFTYGDNNKTVEVKSDTSKLTVGRPIISGEDGTGQKVGVTGPEDVTVIEGTQDVTYKVEIQGEASGTLSYQWYKNSSNSTTGGEQIPGTNQNTYTIPKEEVTGIKNGTYYYCEITQNYNNVINKIISPRAGLLTVIAKGQTNITPQEGTSYVGEITTYTVTAQGEGNFKYEWYYNETGSSKIEESTKIEGATNSTYNAVFNKQGTYTILCKVTQSYGTEATNILKATLKVAEKPSKKNIEIIPQTASIFKGENQGYQVQIKDATYTNVTYMWYYNKENVGGKGTQGGTGDKYTITPQEEGTYYISCVLVFSYGTNVVTVPVTSDTVVLNVGTKLSEDGSTGSKVEGPEGQKTIEQTQNVTFEAKVTGASGNISYQWYSNKENNNTNGTQIPEANQSIYTIPQNEVTQDKNNTYYYCKITQDYNGKTAEITTKAASLTVVSKAQITTQPIAQNTIEGKEEITFNVQASGLDNLSYQWYYNTINSTENGNIISGANKSTYTIPQGEVTQSLNGRYYYCEVTQNYNGKTYKVNSQTALLTVVAPVKITTKPKNVTVTQGNTATFSIEAEGTGNLTYQWYKNTENNTANGTPIDGANQKEYTTQNLTNEDNNTYYYCKVTQSYGKVTEEVVSEVALLTVGDQGSISNPSNVETIEGINDVSFTAQTTGSGEFTYQWYKNSSNSTTGGSPIGGANQSTYTIPKEQVTTSLNNTYYYCKAKQTYGTSTKEITSDAAKLSVVGKVGITKEPEEVKAIEGNTAEFNIQAQGEGILTYQWYSNKENNNTNGTQISGANQNTYAKPNLTTGDNGTYYYCKITQKYGSAVATTTSKTVGLTVVSKASITSNPQAVNTIEGQKEVSFTVEAKGVDTLSYQWYYNTTNSNQGGTKITNATSNTYTISKEEVTQSLNGRYYYCEITQNYNGRTYKVNSQTALLTVVGQVEITSEPNNVTVTQGNTATFNITAQGIGNITYQWYKNTANNTESGTLISEATKNTYTTGGLTEEESGTYYYCKVTQEYGNTKITVTSKTAMLTVGKQGTIASPSNVETIKGVNDVNFTAQATGSGTFTYQWYKNNSNSTENGTKIEKATSNTYTIPKEEVTIGLNNTYYYCKAEQTYGSSKKTLTTSAAKLSVIEKVEITKEPQNINTIEGKTVSYTVEAQGDGTVSYQWYKNSSNSNQGGQAIPGAITATYTIPENEVTTNLNNTYYYCVVTQKYGISTTTKVSNPANLIVTAKAKITKEPTAQTALVGDKVTFSIEANGLDSLTYQWYKNSSNSTTNGTPINEGAKASYTTESLNKEDNGTYYYCIVTQNYNGKTYQITSNVVGLTVGEVAIITTQPSDVSVIEGKTNASFRASATGGGTINYQWYKNTTNSNSGGEKITNAINETYTIQAASVTQNLNNTYYYCEITQKYGSSTKTLTTNAAKLNVIEGIKITKEPQGVKTIEGNAVSYIVQTQGEGSLTYQWYKNTSNSTTGGSPIGGANQSTYTIPQDQVTTSQSGTYYYCKVTQKYGSSETSVTSNVAGLTVVSKAQITSSPQAVNMIEGRKEVTFTVGASGLDSLTYQWYYNTTNSNQGGTKITNATSKTYGIPATEVKESLNGRYYYCEVTQNYNGKTYKVNSQTALLTVVAQVNITVQPSNVTVTQGNTATFSVQANGTGNLTYQWYKNTSNSTTGGSPIGGANQSTYTTPELTTGDDGTYYYCRVTQSYGSATAEATSSVATLKVGTQGSISNPNDVSVIEKTTNANFTVNATGSGTFTYQWYKNTSNSNSGGTAISSATSNTYEVPAANVTTSLNNTYYYCIAKQTYGSSTKTLTSNPAKLSVVAKVGIAKEPTAQTAYVGGANASFKVTAQGEGTISYQWYKNTTNANQGGQAIQNAISSTYTVKPTQDLNGAYYYCEITQKYGTSTAKVTTNAAGLTVKTTTITASPTSITAYVGGNNQTVTLSGDNAGTFSIQTQPTSSIATASISGNKITITPKAAGTTSVIAKEANGNKTVTIPIEVKATTISASPTSITAYAGGGAKTITLSGDNAGTFSIQTQPTSSIATASISGSTLTITPKAEGTTKVTVKEANGNKTLDIPITVKTTTISASPTSITAYAGGGAKTITLSGDNAGTFSIQTQPTSSIATASISGSTLTITPKAAGTTSVVAKEANGNKTVTISITIVANPTITVKTGSSKNYVGNSTTFTATPSGTYDSVTYQWYYNTANTAGSGTQGGTSASYNFSPSTAGTYYLSCKATYKKGTSSVTVTSNTASVIIVATPTLAITPTTGTIYTGNSASMKATPSGTYDSVTYQWYYNTANTAGSGTQGGTSANYSFRTSTAGTYYLSCKATFTYGGTKQVTSTTATIVVKQANYSITEGGKTTYYGKLTETNAAVSDGGTIKVLRNTTESEVVTIGKTVTLDLQNYTLTRINPITVENSLTVRGTGKITSSTNYTIRNQKMLNINGVTIDNTNSTAISNLGEITIGNSGEQLSTTTPMIKGVSYGIDNQGTIHFYNGILKGKIKAYTGNGSMDIRNGCYIAEGTDGEYKTAYLEKGLQVGVIATGDNKTYVDVNGNKAKIPKGFMIVPGCEDISKGLVISDKSGDTEKSSTNKIANGNQFVWIPVDGNNPFQRRQGYRNGSLEDISNFAEVDSTGNNSKVQENQAIKNEAKAMYTSVAENGGFYIGRYEAGIESDTPRTAGAPITADKVVVQKNKNVYNYVGWSDDYSMTTITGGAVELARNFATQQGYDTNKVHSTLCYGVQWDTALNFIDPGYTGYAKDSTGKGNYDESQNTNSWKGKVTTTGASENYKVKNIYDMAGNVGEWTMESCFTDYRANRGGYYDSTGLSFPASFHDGFSPDTFEEDYVGFRITLYL